jgi:cyclopropane fatty-acyl-phospholipid synthase-like methyltransferase
MVPERLAWAVETLDVRPDDRILEIGCGRGVAAALICDRLEGGRLLALDRSAKAIEAASARNAGAVAGGKAQFLTQALEDADPATLGRYDKVFAVNVNAFWVRPARRELDLIRRLLIPDGTLWLFYDPPGRERLAALKSTLTDHLEQAGFRCRTTTHEARRSTLLGVAGEPLRPPRNRTALARE